MSSFSDVDRSTRTGVESLVAYLHSTDRGLAAMKAYMALAAQRELGQGRVLDLGCGVGHDLGRIGALGMHPIGIDSSLEMLTRARAGAGPGVPLTQADGAALPFADGTLDGCRIERVLQHVADPEAVLDEVRRVLRDGGFVAVFEPDYTTFRVASDEAPDGGLPARLLRARHPSIGGRLAGLLEARGFVVDDVVTESSRGYHYDRLPIDTAAVVARAVSEGRIEREPAARWVAEQERRSADGTFRSSWDKVLVVARRGPRTGR